MGSPIRRRANAGQREVTLMDVARADGSVGGELLHPTLASVVIPVRDVARRVVRRALAQTGGTGDREPGALVPAWLRTGDSTGPPDAEPGR